jgi:predicted kinase
MRKWMQDKLKRRKKTPEEKAADPAPLQPAFYDTAPPPEPPAARATSEPTPEVRRVAAETDSSSSISMPASESSSGAQTSGGVQRPRRRRGRGGRGRRSSSPQPAVAGDDSSAALPAPAAPSRPQGAPKGAVILAVGLPGSGKSSWFKRHNITPLSSDMLRSLLFDDPAEQRFQDLVFSNLRSMLKARLIAHRPLNYVDATNLTPQERQNWIKLAKDFGYEVQAVFFDVPLEVCIERHQRRDRLVPEDVMRKMSAKLKAPTFDEGFSKITVVRVKQQKPE